MSAPKSLKDFKKQTNANNQNSILSKGFGFDNSDMANNNNGNNQPQQQQRPLEFVSQSSQSGEFNPNFKPNFDSVYQQVKENPITPDNTPEVAPPDYPVQNSYDREVNNTFFGQPQQVQTQQQIPPQTQPEFSAQVQRQVEYTEPVPTQTHKETTEFDNKIEEFKNAPQQSYQQIAKQDKGNGQPKQNKNLASHMQEVEDEINGLVSNTEAFLNNTKLLKIKILETHSVEELQSVMVEVRRTLEEIPESFIDADIIRKIRVCFSYLQSEKKQALQKEEKLQKEYDEAIERLEKEHREAKEKLEENRKDEENKLRDKQRDLERLVSIDTVEELEDIILDIPATPATDSVYEIRTFEINLINQLPATKEEMFREKIRKEVI